jgi:AraC family transcriptional regulator of adaptative response / DNA-3-methyladenine glycosylase II
MADNGERICGRPVMMPAMFDLGLDCYQALRARDARFDGKFFVGVKTTGIYCRPVCAARTPRASSCVFLATAAAAERAGFRPCLRCRPELAPGGGNGPALAEALYAAIRARVAHGDSVQELAGPTGYSPRQLRRLTMQAFGVTPVEIVQTERLLFAKRLLHETCLPVGEVALAVGFRSLRRFNALFRARYRLAPTALRASARAGASAASSHPAAGGDLTLRLAYRPPLAWAELLRYLAKRAVPGVEAVSVAHGTYARTVSLGGKVGWVAVGPCPGEHALQVRTPAALAGELWPLLARLRTLFDLDANPTRIDEHLRADPLLVPSVDAHPGLRVPGCWEVFELAVRAVLGQQVSVAGATTLAGRLAARFGTPIDPAHGLLTRLSPSPGVLATAPLDDVAALGLPRARAQTVRDLAASAARGELDFPPGAELASVVASLCKIRGIGPWTAQYVAMRALRYPDAFPAADLGVRKALASASGTLPGEQAVLARSAAWRPWRSYAVLHLWQGHPAATEPSLSSR